MAEAVSPPHTLVINPIAITPPNSARYTSATSNGLTTTINSAAMIVASARLIAQPRVRAPSLINILRFTPIGCYAPPIRPHADAANRQHHADQQRRQQAAQAR